MYKLLITHLPILPSRGVHVAVVALAALLVQLALHYTYLPWWCGDSRSYASAASIFYGSGFTKYTIERTPGYPIFLIVCDLLSHSRVGWMLTPRAAQVATWIQSALCVASAVMLYLSIERLQIRPMVNFVVSLLFALLIGVNLFALLILSETLSAFFLMLAVYLATISVDRLRRGLPPATFALLTGVAFSFATLTRPNLLFAWLLFVAAIPLFLGYRMLRRSPLAAALALEGLTRPCLAGGALFLITWLLFNYEHTGIVTLTTVIDVDRACAAYNLFDQVEPKDKVLGEIMTRYYHQKNANGRLDKIYVWWAYDEILSHVDEMPVHVAPSYEDLRNFALDRYIGSVADELLLKHPVTWAENSIADFATTFDFRFYLTTPGVMDDPVGVTKPPRPVIVSERGWRTLCAVEGLQPWLILLAYILTFAATVFSLRSVAAATDLKAALIPLTLACFSISAIFCMSAPSILATYFTRYSVPLIPLFAISSAYVIDQALTARRSAGK